MPVKTSVDSTSAKPPRTKVTFPQNILLFFSTATQIYKPSSTKVSPTPVKTSVGSTDARPPRTKVTFPQRVFLFWPFFSTRHKSTNHPLGVSDACEDLSWLNWCKTSSDKGYFSSKCFSLLAIFLNTTQFYESSIRCLRRL